MADLDLTALRAKAEAATPGPWSVRVGSDGAYAGQIEPNITRWGGISMPATIGKLNAAYIAAANPAVVLALLDRVEKAEALIAKAGKATPAYKAVEKALDEHSAWIARPNREVTEAIALAAVIAADIETGASHVLGALHERCDAAEAEIAACRALLARAGEALRPFADDELHEGLGDGPDDMQTWWPGMRLGDYRTARTVAREIDEATR